MSTHSVDAERMPAITLGLAEVEERLHGLRRRLNTLTLLHVGFVTMTVVCLVAAAWVAVGVRGDVQSFRSVTWLSLALLAAAAAGALMAVWRRWLDESATAKLVDARGQLTDRLTTLMDLRRRPRPSRLAPVLIAQTLALGERWRPQRIVPRRVPRSIVPALLSLLALTASPLVAPEPPPPPPSPKHVERSLGGLPPEELPAASRLGDGDAAEGAEGAPMLPRAGDVPAPQPDAQPRAAAPPVPATDRVLGLLPDRLHSALLSAFRAEQAGQGHDLGKDPTGRQLGKDTTSQAKDMTGQSKEHASVAPDDRASAPADDQRERGSGAAGKHPGKGDTAPQAQPRPGDGSNADPRQDRAQDRSPDAGEQGHGGSAPNAGTGSRPENLLAAGAAAADSGHAGSATFKLTITSFLHAVEEQAKPERPTDKRAAGVAGAVSAAAAVPALNAQQLRDDALRKAEIPPEYEDLVRRVYSARPRDGQDALRGGPVVTGAVGGEPMGSAVSKGRGTPSADR